MHQPLIDNLIISTGYNTESKVDSFTVESVIREYHIYKEVWSSVIGAVLVYHHDTQNCHNPFAVDICKGTTVVGHMPRQISAICYISSVLSSFDQWFGVKLNSQSLGNFLAGMLMSCPGRLVQMARSQHSLFHKQQP